MVDLGTARGQVSLDIKQALAAYSILRATNASTMGSLATSSRVFTKTGLAFLGASALIVAGFTKAVSSAANFEKRLSQFGAVSASTQDEMDAVREKALQLGRDTIFSANQVADAFVDLAKAGVTAEEIVAGVGDAAVKMAAATDIPLGKSATVIVNAMQTYNLAAKDAVRISDLLAGAANASTVEIDDLATSLKYAGAPAAALGISLEDTATALGILGEAGIRGSTGGTSLRRILLNLSPPSDKAQAALKKLGIITEQGSNLFYDAAGNAKSLSDISQILQDKLKGLTKEQKVQALNTIFGNRAVSSALVLARGGEKAFTAMNDAINRTSAAEVSAKRLDNLSGSIEILRGSLETAFIEAGASAQEPIREIVDLLTRLVNAFSALSPKTQEMIVRIALIAAAFLAIVGTVSLVIGLFLKLWQIFKQVKMAIAFIRALAAAMKVFTMSLLTNPVFLIIAAVVALGIALFVLYKKSETFRKFIDALWQTTQRVWDDILSFFKGLPRWFSDRWQAIVEAGKSFVNFFKALPGRVAGWVGAIAQWFADLPGRVVSALASFGTWVGQKFIELFNRAKQIVSTGITAVINFFQQLPYRVGFALGFLLGRIVWFFKLYYTTMFNGAKAAFTAVVNFFKLLPGRVVTFFSAVWRAIVRYLKQSGNSAKTGGATILRNIINFIKQLPGRVGAFFANMVARIATAASNAKTRATTLGKNVLSAIVNFFKQLPGKVSEWFGKLRAKIYDIRNSIAAAAKSVGSNIVNGLVNIITGLPGQVSAIFGRIVDAIKSKITEAFNSVRDFARGMWDGFKSGLGIGSPSFLEYATWDIVDNVTQGTKDLSKQVRTMQRIGRTLPNINTALSTTEAAGSTRRIAGMVSGESGGSRPTGSRTNIYLDVVNPIPEESSVILQDRLTSIAQLGLIDQPDVVVGGTA